MYPSKISVLLFTLLVTSYSELAMKKSFALKAELGTIWRNNPSLLHNISPYDNFSLRIILPKDARAAMPRSAFDGPSFACGFFCAGPSATCDDYTFSIFAVNGYSFGDVVYFHSPMVVWPANRDHPVKENASVQFTELGDLVLYYDPDGTPVWSTNTADMSVAGMNLTSTGNLVLFNHTNMKYGSLDVMDPVHDVAYTASGKQRRRLRRAGRKPARISGPEWTS